MAAINDLISQIQDETLRNRIQEEVSKMAKQKKFGLVFEEHMPESTPLYDVPIKSGCNVMRRDSKDDKSIYVVLKVEGDTAVCVKPEQKDETATFELKDIVRVAEFGESIYPYLKPLDSVCNAPDSDLWHTLIEADNYHALQLLEYLYAGKVDCIYIDPPYNTGAKDWKYNNDYVDGNDAYRHSKWLSFMQRRLQLAKKLLNPADSVLIVTIDEKEYLHLGCLLEEIFPEANMQMVSSVINPAGVSRHGAFARVDEYIYIIRIGTSEAQRVNLSDEWRIRPNDKRATMLRWNTLIRTGTNVRRSDRKNLFYPIFVREDGKAIHSVGEPYYGTNLNEVQAPEGTVAIWPIRSNGEEGNWQIANTGLMELAQKGYVHLGRLYGDNVIEKHGINRDSTGDREKTRYLCGKQGIFTRDRALIRPGFIRQLETRASTRSASFFHALGSPGRPHNGGGEAGAYRTRNGAKPLKQGHLRAKRGPLGPSRKSQQQTKRMGFAAHGHSIAETAPEGKRASCANGALIRA